MIRNCLLVTAATVALFVLAASPAAAQVSVDYGTPELGEVRTGCFSVCFGNGCSGSGTIDSVTTATPFVVRGLRTGASGSDVCGTPGISTPTTLPVTLLPGEKLVFDADIVPLDVGAVTDVPLSINGNSSFLLSADIVPVFTCQSSGNALCLQDDRFKTRVHWRTEFGSRGSGQIVAGVAPDDSGLFYFFNPNNWEMLIKVLDACDAPFNRFWVFAAATTNVEYTITVVDTETQETNAYFKPQGPPAPAITDTQAFATCP